MSIYDTLRPVGTSIVDRFANDNPILHERPTKVRDDGGGSAVTWAEVGSYAGAVVPLSGGEQFKLDRNNITATHAVYLNNTDGQNVQNGDRFTFRTRVFNVRLIQNIGEADAVFKITAEEGTGA